MLKLAPLLEGKRHVIWDWNGTLLSDLTAAVATVNHLLASENLPSITEAEHRRTFGFPVVDYYRGLGFDVSPANFADLCARFNAHFDANLDTCELWPDVRRLLAIVKATGATQSLLSLTAHPNLVAMVARFELEPYFDHVVGHTDQLAASKVDRGHELMARVAESPADTVLIGDTDHDLEVGRALGVDVILVEHGHQCPTRLRALHDRVVRVF